MGNSHSLHLFDDHADRHVAVNSAEVAANATHAISAAQPVDLHWIMQRERDSDSDVLVASEPTVQDLAVAQGVHRLLFGDVEPVRHTSLADTCQRFQTAAASSSSSSASSSLPTIFDAWRAVEARDTAALGAILSQNPDVVTQPLQLNYAAIQRRRVLLQRLRAELSAEDGRLAQALAAPRQPNAMAIALDANHTPTIDLLLDRGVGLGGSVRVLSAALRVMDADRIGRLLANSTELDLVHLERCFFLTKQRLHGPFPFVQLRDGLEAAFVHATHLGRNRLYALIELLRSRPHAAVPGADQAVVQFVALVTRLPQLCRALIVEKAVRFDAPTPAECNHIVVLDTVQTFMRASILDERVTAAGEEVFVRFDNWTDGRYDEWLPRSSPRIVPFVHPRLKAAAMGEFVPKI